MDLEIRWELEVLLWGSLSISTTSTIRPELHCPWCHFIVWEKKDPSLPVFYCMGEKRGKILTVKIASFRRLRHGYVHGYASVTSFIIRV